MKRTDLRIALIITVILFGLGGWRWMQAGDEFFVTGDQRGWSLYADASYQSAAEAFNSPTWKAIALYRAGEFEEAEGILRGIEGADALFNRGNCLVMQGKYEQAIECYEDALKERPQWKEAETNLKIARGRAERIKKEGGDMTGGMLGADDITFDGKKSPGGQKEITESDQPMNDQQIRKIWLRQVQTTPGQFLRSKFAYQLSAESNAKQGTDESKESKGGTNEN